MQLWTSAINNHSIRDIKDFGEHIKKMGDHYSLKILHTYGEKLISLASIFDIEKMEATLASYPQLIEEIKSKR